MKAVDVVLANCARTADGDKDDTCPAYACVVP